MANPPDMERLLEALEVAIKEASVLKANLVVHLLKMAILAARKANKENPGGHPDHPAFRQ